jgi:hypothetical protein
MNVLQILAIVLLAQSGASPPVRMAALQGAVVKVVTNEPIPNAAVELRSLDAGPARIYTSTTSRDGRFGFRLVPPGRYQLTAMRGGYVRGDYGLRGPGASGLTVTLAAGQRMADVKLAMRATGTIAGRVTDLQGEAVGNVHVKALRYSYQDGRVSLIDVKSVFTNDLGEYRLGWLPPGLYNVSALHPDALVNALSLPETINSATIVGTVVTNPGGMNGGSFNSSGNPDPAVRARIGLAAGEDYVPVYFPGTFDHRAAAAIDVRSGTEVNGVDLIVSPIRTASITGVVRPLPSSRPGIAAVRTQLLVSRNPTYNNRTVGVAVSPQTGTFSISGLAPGSYVLAAGTGNGDERVTGRAVVNVSEGGFESAQVVLERGMQIPVAIAVEGAADLSGLRVSLRTDPVIPGLADTPAATRAADGSILLTGVTAGDYRVNIAPLMTLIPATPTNPPPAVPGPAQGTPAVRLPPSRPAYVKSIRFGGADVLNDRLHVDDTTAGTPLEIVVGTNPGQIDGVAVDAARKPAPYVTVVLVPKPDRRQRMDLYKIVTTDAAGRFRIPNIPPEDYKLFAWEDVETNAWLDPQFIRLDEEQGQALRIGEGARATVNVPVIPAR